MINSYTFYRLQRMGLVVVPAIKSSSNVLHVNTFVLHHGGVDYHIDDYGLNEDDLDGSLLGSMSLSMIHMIQNFLTSKIKLLKKDIDAVYGKKLDLHIGTDSDMISIEFYDEEVLAAIFYIIPYPDDLVKYYNNIFQHNKLGMDHPKYDKPTIEVYSKKLRKLNVQEEHGVVVKQCQ